MAFGGVATGSIKAQVAAKATGIAKSRTLCSVYPSPPATPMITGMKAAAVAVFDVISVKKITSAVTASITITIGNMLRLLTCSPIHRLRPVLPNCAERARPPPNSNKISHGRCFAVFQSIRRSPLLFAGMINNIIATLIAIIESREPILIP